MQSDSEGHWPSLIAKEPKRGGGRTTLNQYYDDGLVKSVSDLHYGSNFNRSYEYDQAGRFVRAHAGGNGPDVFKSLFSGLQL